MQIQSSDAGQITSHDEADNQSPPPHGEIKTKNQRNQSNSLEKREVNVMKTAIEA